MLDMAGGFLTKERGSIEVKVRNGAGVKCGKCPEATKTSKKSQLNSYRARASCRPTGWRESTTGSKDKNETPYQIKATNIAHISTRNIINFSKTSYSLHKSTTEFEVSWQKT